MVSGEKKQGLRIRILRRILKMHNELYYVYADPVVTDYEYDLLMKDLEALEKKYPQFDDPTSPSKMPGSDLNN